jgi:hypothetical protein
MPTEPNIFLSLCTLFYRSLVYLAFISATALLLGLPHWIKANDTGSIFLLWLVITSPFVFIFLAMVLHKLLPNELNLKCGLMLYTVSIFNTVNHIGVCCTRHSSGCELTFGFSCSSLRAIT